MLIYSEKRLVPTEVNMLVIKGSNGYYYIHRALYDQAVVLYDIYHDDFNLLLQAITGSTASRPDVDLFFNTAPVPINILGAFLMYVNTELTEFEDMVGAIHVMSGPYNLRKLIQVPIEARNNPSFSLSIREEYELGWDRFFSTAQEYNVQTETVTYKPMNGTATVTIPEGTTPVPAPTPTAEPEPEPEPEVEVEDEVIDVKEYLKTLPPGADYVTYINNDKNLTEDQKTQVMTDVCILDLNDELELYLPQAPAEPAPAPESAPAEPAPASAPAPAPEPAPIEEAPVDKTELSGLELLSKGLI